MFEQKKKIKSYFDIETKKKLNYWEKKFISSLYNTPNIWTEKQNETLDKIIKKYTVKEKPVVHTITYLPIGYAQGAVVNQKITSKNYRKNRFIGKKKA